METTDNAPINNDTINGPGPFSEVLMCLVQVEKFEEQIRLIAARTSLDSPLITQLREKKKMASERAYAYLEKKYGMKFNPRFGREEIMEYLAQLFSAQMKFIAIHDLKVILYQEIESFVIRSDETH